MEQGDKVRKLKADKAEKVSLMCFLLYGFDVHGIQQTAIILGKTSQVESISSRGYAVIVIY